MIRQILQFIESLPSPVVLIAGVALLLLGGHCLVEGAVRIARRCGVSTLLIGLTIVAFGTSSPELAFNVTAALNGNGDLSFGNVVGSNIANIALVLGLAALVCPLTVAGRVLSRELPLLIVASAAMIGLARMRPTIGVNGFAQHGFGRTDGIILLLGFMFMTWLWYRLGKKDRADPLSSEFEEEARRSRHMGLPTAFTLFFLGLASLVAGGKLTEVGAVGVATALGLSQALIGLTVVAVATSLPEVVTSLIAARKGHADLAVGNVVGSNLFNILLVLGATSAIAPVPVPDEPGWFGLTRGWWDLFVMLGLTIVLVPFAIKADRRIVKAEGVFLLVCYFGYMLLCVIRELREAG
jgi:cation:H+ antiporter